MRKGDVAVIWRSSRQEMPGRGYVDLAIPRQVNIFEQWVWMYMSGRYAPGNDNPAVRCVR